MLSSGNHSAIELIEGEDKGILEILLAITKILSYLEALLF